MLGRRSRSVLLNITIGDAIQSLDWTRAALAFVLIWAGQGS
jgi:hypothetical protein